MNDFLPKEMTLKVRVKVFAWLFMIAFVCLFSSDMARTMLRGYGLERQDRLNELLKRRSS